MALQLPLLALFVTAGAAQADPCALRAHVDKSSAELVPLVDQQTDPRARACWNVVTGVALSREGHGSDAVTRFSLAAPALPELSTFLELAARRATAAPAAAAPLPAPKTADEAAALVMRLLREAKPKKAVEVALAFPREAAASPHEALEVATVTALVRADRIDDGLAAAAKLPAGDAFAKVGAWALSKAGRFIPARDAFAALATRTLDPALRAEATFYAAFSSYEANDLDDAKARFAAGSEAMKGTTFEAGGRWYLAFCDLLRGRFADAVPVLEALAKELPADRELLKHRYWLARARIDSGDAAQKRTGIAELGSLAASDPTDVYGLLARHRLKKKPLRGARVAPDAVAHLATDLLRDDPQARTAMLLFNLGLDDEARTVARALGEELPALGVQQRVGDAHFGWRRGARFIPVPRAKGGALVNDPRWRVSYAEPWHDAVTAAAAKAGVPPSFVYAIMRTESGFDPRAVSVAGAQGVIQLLPSAARGACGLAGRPVLDAQRIFDPVVAVDLGAALLGRNNQELGSLLLAAAAYNGGAHNVAKWMKDYRHLELELFIERIPFRETRDYVKRVLAVEATYRALDGGALTLDLPAGIGEPPAQLTHFPMDE